MFVCLASIADAVLRLESMVEALSRKNLSLLFAYAELTLKQTNVFLVRRFLHGQLIGSIFNTDFCYTYWLRSGEGPSSKKKIEISVMSFISKPFANILIYISKYIHPKYIYIYKCHVLTNSLLIKDVYPEMQGKLRKASGCEQSQSAVIAAEAWLVQ